MACLVLFPWPKWVQEISGNHFVLGKQEISMSFLQWKVRLRLLLDTFSGICWCCWCLMMFGCITSSSVTGFGTSEFFSTSVLYSMHQISWATARFMWKKIKYKITSGEHLLPVLDSHESSDSCDLLPTSAVSPDVTAASLCTGECNGCQVMRERTVVIRPWNQNHANWGTLIDSNPCTSTPFVCWLQWFNGLWIKINSTCFKGFPPASTQFYQGNLLAKIPESHWNDKLRCPRLLRASSLALDGFSNTSSSTLSWKGRRYQAKNVLPALLLCNLCRAGVWWSFDNWKMETCMYYSSIANIT